MSLRHTRAHLARAAFEGVAFALRDGLAALPESQAETLLLVGGGSLQPAWRQLLADVLGKALAASPVSTASARGAALLAGIASGAFTFETALELTPDPSFVAKPQPKPRLEEAYARYQSLYPAVRGSTQLGHTQTEG